MKNSIGIIGGTGLDDSRFFEPDSQILAQTPYGEPSGPLVSGKVAGHSLVLLSRHGSGHVIPPSQVNNRANIHALHQAGCTHIIATAACGSLRKRIKPGMLVVPDQFIDFTRHRAVTFHESFPSGVENACHAFMADPFSTTVKQSLLQAGRAQNMPVHDGGTLITIEGPRFSTRAESRMFRAWGADLVNMTIAPEAILANELSIPYAVVAMITDYDCWNEADPPLRVDELVRVFKENVARLTSLIVQSLPLLGHTA